MSTKLHFDTPFSFEKTCNIVRELTIHLVGHDHQLVSAIDRKDWDYVLDYSPMSDSGWANADAWTIKNQMQAGAFFKKNASVPIAVARDVAALNTFLDAETKCEATNRRFRNRSLPFSKGGLDAGLIFEVQRKIAGILGPFPGVENLDLAFGPGANVGLSRFTSVRRKLSTRPTCTAGAWKYLKVIQEYSPHWTMLANARNVNYGKYASVPKSAKTNRSILVEPLVNSYLQKGVGTYIRRRLMKVGINLNDQSFNQELALLGSVTGEWATIDLSAASDTLASEVVKELLPFDWWCFLTDIRSQYARLPDGREIYLQKFSSMGNGFTFELESLIFFAIASSISRNLVQVYGDDIIVASRDFERVASGLEHFGFQLNAEKSFATGLFRESCGKDYFGGISVRPCYLKSLLSVKELFRLHNFFVREERHDLAALCLRHIPARFLHFGPDGYGDGHLLGDHQKTLSRSLRKRGFGGYVFRTYTTRPTRMLKPLVGDLAAFYYLTAQQQCSWWKPSATCASSSMYQERGSTRYVMSRVYTYGEG